MKVKYSYNKALKIKICKQGKKGSKVNYSYNKALKICVIIVHLDTQSTNT